MPGKRGTSNRDAGVAQVNIDPIIGRWIFKNVDRFSGASGFCVGPVRSVFSEGWTEPVTGDDFSGFNRGSGVYTVLRCKIELSMRDFSGSKIPGE